MGEEAPQIDTALIYWDTHMDPEVYVGSLSECRYAFIRYVTEYLAWHPWPQHRDAARTLAMLARTDDAAAVEWGLNYLSEHVEYLDCYIVPAQWALAGRALAATGRASGAEGE